jgi:hypothetical protein
MEAKLLTFMACSCAKRLDPTARTALTHHETEVANMVGISNDRASIKNSNADHACAVNMIPEYIELLVEFVPFVERRSVAPVGKLSRRPDARLNLGPFLLRSLLTKNVRINDTMKASARVAERTVIFIMRAKENME